MNEGILLKDEKRSKIKNYRCNIFINYPSHYIKLDVPREKIVKMLKVDELTTDMKDLMENKMMYWINQLLTNKSDVKLVDVDNMYLFMKMNNINCKNILLNMYGLKITVINEKIKFKITKDSIESNDSILIRGNYSDFLRQALCKVDLIKHLVSIINKTKENQYDDNESNIRMRIEYRIKLRSQFENMKEIIDKVFSNNKEHSLERLITELEVELKSQEYRIETDFNRSSEYVYAGIDLKESEREYLVENSSFNIENKRFKELLFSSFDFMGNINSEASSFDILYSMYKFKNLLFKYIKIDSLIKKEELEL